MPTERIYGRDCWVPDVPAVEEITADRKFQLTEIPDIFDEKLRAIAKAEGRSISNLVSLAIETFLRDYKPVQK